MHDHSFGVFTFIASEQPTNVSWGGGSWGSEMGPFDSPPITYCVSIDIYGLSLTRFELFNWLQKRSCPSARQSDPDTKTNTALEVTASCFICIGNNVFLYLHSLADECCRIRCGTSSGQRKAFVVRFNYSCEQNSVSTWSCSTAIYIIYDVDMSLASVAYANRGHKEKEKDEDTFFFRKIK